MEEMDEIKLIWKELDQRLSYLEEENSRLAQTVMKVNYRSATEKLSRKYIGCIFLESIMIIFMNMFFIFNPEINDKFRIPALIYWDIFFLIELSFDLFLLLKIKSINIYNSPINEVANIAAKNWKIHKVCVIIGLPLAFGAIFLFALALNANEFVILGMIVGGVIGLCIGITQLIKFKDYYKLLQTIE